MGLFNRLFQKDPAKDLARAEKLLTRGDALEAVRLVVRAEENGAGASAEPLASKVREAVAASALEHAMRSKKDEYWADAAEWLEQALPYVDEGHREQFKTLIAEFHRLEDQANQAELPEALRADGGTSGPVEGEDFASDDLYDVYVESLREDVAKHFVERPQSFRHAVVSLNGGELESALELLEELTGADPHDPVLRLERGRARLAHGQIEGACEDLEAAWEQLGDEPLDHAGHLSIPALWGEAQLAQKNAAGAVERLRDLMDPRGADLEVFKVYAQALLAEKEFDEAARFLTEAWGYHP